MTVGETRLWQRQTVLPMTNKLTNSYVSNAFDRNQLRLLRTQGAKFSAAAWPAETYISYLLLPTLISSLKRWPV